MLIEYDDGKLQLATVTQMFENKDTTIKYATPIVKMSEPIGTTLRQSTKLPPQVKEYYTSMAMPGNNITHNKYGMGAITEFYGEYITIRFEGVDEPKKFGLVSSIQDGFFEFNAPSFGGVQQ